MIFVNFPFLTDFCKNDPKFRRLGFLNAGNPQPPRIVDARWRVQNHPLSENLCGVKLGRNGFLRTQRFPLCRQAHVLGVGGAQVLGVGGFGARCRINTRTADPSALLPWNVGPHSAAGRCHPKVITRPPPARRHIQSFCRLPLPNRYVET